MSEEIKKENAQPAEETPAAEHTENQDAKKAKKGKKGRHGDLHCGRG